MAVNFTAKEVAEMRLQLRGQICVGMLSGSLMVGEGRLDVLKAEIVTLSGELTDAVLTAEGIVAATPVVPESLPVWQDMSTAPRDRRILLRLLPKETFDMKAKVVIGSFFNSKRLDPCWLFNGDNTVPLDGADGWVELPTP